MTAADQETAPSNETTPGKTSSLSNIRLPANLFDRVKARCEAGSYAPGELIIVAIEDAGQQHEEAVENLKRALSTGVPTVGGTFFEERLAAQAQRSPGHTRRLQFELRASDFVVLDQFVKACDAKNRSRLIRAALTRYLVAPEPTL